MLGLGLFFELWPRLVTGKPRKTHLIGFSSLMSLREATIPCISATLRKNPGIKDKLERIMAKFVKEAKADVQDWYSEVTFRRERQRGALKARKASKKDKGRKEEAEEKCDESDEDEGEDDLEVDMENSESEDDPCAEEMPDDKNGESDGDIFGGRFSSPAPSTTTSTRTPCGSDPRGPNFKKHLSDMIENAMKCGALPAASWFIEVWAL